MRASTTPSSTRKTTACSSATPRRCSTRCSPLSRGGESVPAVPPTGLKFPARWPITRYLETRPGRPGGWPGRWRSRGAIGEHTMSQKGGVMQPVYLESLVAKIGGWSDPEARLREAFAEDEFMLLGQSIVPLDGKKPMPFRLELLVRLQEEELNMTPPGAFFPALEACGMMPMLDRWVIARAAAWWREKDGVANTVLHVNLAPETLDEKDFADFVQAQLRECRMPAG